MQTFLSFESSNDDQLIEFSLERDNLKKKKAETSDLKSGSDKS